MFFEREKKKSYTFYDKTGCGRSDPKEKSVSNVSDVARGSGGSGPTPKFKKTADFECTQGELLVYYKNTTVQTKLYG